MKKPVRPGLDALPFATKKSPTAETPPAAATSPAEASKSDDRVTIIIRVAEKDRRSLKRIAAIEGTTIQAMMEAAIADILRRSS